ncbi:MAG: TraR/DksA C4-type zinc finger protein [Spirochaetales bacterium]|nr:TraR/DksA C4-type zinc finger protein [Leptospiraceae bacterium]MCP5482086.1 TraR/DksA C4-type zinc finger protein [Spirochaetales bacterium]MCP5484958.1 TraR/DksA C4-type zinc finger protein [Spirochaetales bacterium]
MRSEEKQAIREKMIAEMRALEKNVRTLEEATRPIKPDVSLGRLTRMDAIQNRSVSESALRDARAKLGAIKTALDKLEGDNYGVCVSCGSQIAPARLEFMPESTTCVDCAS